MIYPAPDHLLLFKKVRHLTQALMISGLVNIGLVFFLAYFAMRERPPTPYCELKPATLSQEQVPLADMRTCGVVIAQLHKLSYDQLVAKLRQNQLVENGYTERDLALSCLVAFHHFDLSRALPRESKPDQQRLLMWKPAGKDQSVPLVMYPGLTDQHFESIIHFARTEKWPMTSKGLFLTLQKQKDEMNIDLSLAEAFMLMPEFTTVELLFTRMELPIRKQELLEIVLDGNWPLLSQFVEQQKQVNDLSIARRQKFLLDYIKAGSAVAAYLLLKTDLDFAIKKLDDAQVIAILQKLSQKNPESEKFSLEMLTSPRSTSVWQQASLRLYEYAGEPIPADWNYKTSILRFAPHKLVAEKESKPAALTPASTVSNVVAVATPAVNPVTSTSVNNVNAVSKTQSPPVVSSPKATPKVETPSKAVAVDKTSITKKTAQAQTTVKKPCRLYIVQEGDSLWKISRRFAVDMEVLKEQNNLQSNAIKPGCVLKIP